MGITWIWEIQRPRLARDTHENVPHSGRILTDLRKLNAVLKKPPAHWVDSVLDAKDLSSEVPVGSTHFLGCDISDAFSTCKLTERAQKLCVWELNGRYFMCLGGP